VRRLGLSAAAPPTSSSISSHLLRALTFVLVTIIIGEKCVRREGRIE
jgi:hypothetical protein